jgi:oligopeptide transport system ATP-binding protein
MKVCLSDQPEEISINSEHKAACWMNVKEVYDEAANGGKQQGGEGK